METASQLDSDFQINHTNALGLSVVPTSQPIHSCTYSSCTDGESQFAKDAMFKFASECINSLASAVASVRSSGVEAQPVDIIEE